MILFWLKSTECTNNVLTLSCSLRFPPFTESISFFTMKLSNLRVDTRSSDTLPLLTNVFRSDTAWPEVSTNHRYSLDYQQEPSTEIDSSQRTIRRTFSFDEWDEENVQDDSELDLQHTILRSFAFDEWDKDEGSTESVTSATPSGRFAPIRNSGATSDIDSPPAKLPSFRRFKVNSTKFDLDEDTTQPTVAVTPSPPPKLQRPIPLYSHQSIEFPANPFETVYFETKKQEPILPKDPHCMESMIRASFVPSFPLVCQSIPRKASAFSIPRVNRDSFPPKAHNSESNMNDTNRQQEAHWFDMYGSGTTLFEDDDYIFESPTSSLSDEDSLYSASTIPRFIICHQEDEWVCFYKHCTNTIRFFELDLQIQTKIIYTQKKKVCTHQNYFLMALECHHGVVEAACLLS